MLVVFSVHSGVHVMRFSLDFTILQCHYWQTRSRFCWAQEKDYDELTVCWWYDVCIDLVTNRLRLCCLCNINGQGIVFTESLIARSGDRILLKKTVN